MKDNAFHKRKEAEKRAANARARKAEAERLANQPDLTSFHKQIAADKARFAADPNRRCLIRPPHIEEVRRHGPATAVVATPANTGFQGYYFLKNYTELQDVGGKIVLAGEPSRPALMALTAKLITSGLGTYAVIELLRDHLCGPEFRDEVPSIVAEGQKFSPRIVAGRVPVQGMPLQAVARALQAVRRELQPSRSRPTRTRRWPRRSSLTSRCLTSTGPSLMAYSAR
jgi:hypothetical protein